MRTVFAMVAVLAVAAWASAQSPVYVIPDEYILPFDELYTGDTTDTSWYLEELDWENYQKTIHTSFRYAVSLAVNGEDLMEAIENYFIAYETIVPVMMKRCSLNVGFDYTKWASSDPTYIYLTLIDANGDSFNDPLNLPSYNDVEDVRMLPDIYSGSWGTNEVSGNPEFTIAPSLPACLDVGEFRYTGTPADVDAFHDWLDEFWDDINTRQPGWTRVPIETMLDCYQDKWVDQESIGFIPYEILPHTDLPGSVMKPQPCSIDSPPPAMVCPPFAVPEGPNFWVPQRHIPTGPRESIRDCIKQEWNSTWNDIERWLIYNIEDLPTKCDCDIYEE